MHTTDPRIPRQTQALAAASLIQPLNKAIATTTKQLENDALRIYKQTTSRVYITPKYTEALKELSTLKEILKSLSESPDSTQKSKLKHALQMTEGWIAHIEGTEWYGEKMRRKRCHQQRTSLHRKAMQHARQEKTKESAEEAPTLLMTHP